MEAYMKKLLSFALIAALLLTVAACGTPLAIPNPPLVLGEKYLTDLDYEQALLQFDQAIVIEPKNPRGYLGKADALLHLERQSEAAEALSAAAKQCRPQRAALNEAKAAMGKSFVDACIALSTAYETLGWREIALALLRRVCEELPEESRLKDALERLIDGVGQTEAPKSSKTEKTTAAPEAPKKPVKRMIRYSAEGTVLDTTTCEHDAKGQIIRAETHGSDGTSSSWSGTIQYDDKGRMIREEVHQSDGVSGYFTWEYDAEGRVSRQESHASDGTDIVTYSNHEYDAKGNVIRTVTTDSSGNTSTTTTSYEYNAAGQIVRTEWHYDGYSSYSTSEYNAEGLIIRINNYGEGQLQGYTVYEY